MVWQVSVHTLQFIIPERNISQEKYLKSVGWVLGVVIEGKGAGLRIVGLGGVATSLNDFFDFEFSFDFLWGFLLAPFCPSMAAKQLYMMLPLLAMSLPTQACNILFLGDAAVLKWKLWKSYKSIG